MSSGTAFSVQVIPVLAPTQSSLIFQMPKPSQDLPCHTGSAGLSKSIRRWQNLTLLQSFNISTTPWYAGTPLAWICQEQFMDTSSMYILPLYVTTSLSVVCDVFREVYGVYEKSTRLMDKFVQNPPRFQHLDFSMVLVKNDSRWPTDLVYDHNGSLIDKSLPLELIAHSNLYSFVTAPAIAIPPINQWCCPQ